MLGKHAAGSRDARERGRRKQHPPDRPPHHRYRCGPARGSTNPPHPRLRRNPRTRGKGARRGTASTPHPRRTRSGAPRPRQRATGLAVTASYFFPSFNDARPCAWRVFAWARVPRPGQPRQADPTPPGARRRSGRSGAAAAAPAEAEDPSHRGRGGPGAPPTPPSPTGLAAPLCCRGSRSTSRVPAPRPAPWGWRGIPALPRSPISGAPLPRAGLPGRAGVGGRGKRRETHLVSSCATRHGVHRDGTAASSRTGTVKNSREKRSGTNAWPRSSLPSSPPPPYYSPLGQQR